MTLKRQEREVSRNQEACDRRDECRSLGYDQHHAQEDDQGEGNLAGMQAGLLLDEGEGLIIVEAVQLDGLDSLIYVISHELLYRMTNIKEKG